jgi:tetratricopeptide (TPR) repeat protein
MQTKLAILFLLFTFNSLNAYSSDMSKEFNDANALILSGKFVKAKGILNKILENNPNNMQVINNLAYMEAKSGNLDKAIDLLRSYIRNDDDIDIIYKNLTNLYAYQANIIYEEALSLNETESKDLSLFLIENLKLENKTFNSTNLVNKKNNEENIVLEEQVTERDIENFIINWARFWGEKNYKEYFDCYAKNYFPKNFKSRNSWESDRKSKIKNKNEIDIKIKDIKIISDYKKNILIQFTQAYNSDSFSDVVRKHTTAVITNGDIKITGEYILK